MPGWTDPDFLREAHDWIRTHTDVTGPIEQTHVQIWSTVMRVPTIDGTLWFKAPDDPAEAALTEMLANAGPARVPELVATDPRRGWMLMRDAGRRLRDVILKPSDLHHLESALAGYADLQLTMAAHLGRMLEIGVPDFRLKGLPDRIAALLEADEFLMLGQPEGLTEDARRALRAQLPRITSMCDELVMMGIPETIQHDDLSDGNIYEDAGRYRVMDWGDACVSHPFHSLTVVVRATAYRLDLEPGGAELRRLRDAYLEPFSAYASPGTLKRAADTAYRTGTLARALAWHSYVAVRDPEDRAPDLEAVPYGLRKFVENGPLGDWR
jgi:hypothetical protein